MADDQIDPQDGAPAKAPRRASELKMHMEINGNPRGLDPDWAMGLKQLYDAVVDEPLPDAFADLLSKLDAKDPE